MMRRGNAAANGESAAILKRRMLPTLYVPNSFDSSHRRRCHFKTRIGVGEVIKGPVDQFRHKKHPESAYF